MWQESKRLFTQYNGLPIHPDTISGCFRESIKNTDLPSISVRHKNITLMMAAEMRADILKSKSRGEYGIRVV